jgi:branched-chain amino acid transport system permease protein
VNIRPQTLVDGLVIGSSFTLLALGFALVYSISGFLNVAHAEFYMIGAYGAILLTGVIGGALFGAVAGALVVTVVGGALLYNVVLRRLNNQQHMPAFIATAGIGMFLQYGVARLLGTREREFPQIASTRGMDLGIVNISPAQLLVIGVTAVSVIFLMLWIGRSAMGRDIRAVAENEEAAALVGVRVPRIKLITVCVATGLAGIAGVLLGNLYGVLTPFVGAELSLNMFVVVLVAGVGSLGGVAVTGVALGLIQALTIAYVGSQWQYFTGLLVLLLVLLIRPQGLFARKLRSG